MDVCIYLIYRVLHENIMEFDYRNGEIPDELSLANAFFVNPQRFKSFYTKLVRERLKETKLTESSIYFVIVLDDKVGMSLKELSSYVGVDKALTTRMVKAFVDIGYFRKEKGPGNEYSVTLTEEGMAAREKGRKVVEEVMSYLTSDFSEEELHSMNSIIAKFVKKMDNYSP
jgi:Transcriptional regulators